MMDGVDDARERRHRNQQTAVVAAVTYTGPVWCLNPECRLEILPADESRPACQCPSPLGESVDLLVTRLSEEAVSARQQYATLAAELREAQDTNLRLLELLADAQEREAEVAGEMVRMRQSLEEFAQRVRGVLAQPVS